VSSVCKRGNDVKSKRGAFIVLRDLLGIPLGEPTPGEQGLPSQFNTVGIVEAPSVGTAEGVVVEKFDA
jgi:hypothetical protein